MIQVVSFSLKTTMEEKHCALKANPQLKCTQVQKRYISLLLNLNNHFKLLER